MTTRPAPSRREARRGFTLIEMMAVIAIMAMVFAIGIPRLSTSKWRALVTEAESIAASIEFARQRAIMTGIPHRVLIDLEEGGYRIEWLVTEEQAFGEDAEEALPDTRTASTGTGPSDRTPIDLHPPPREKRDYFPIPRRQFGSFTWLDDARYFVGLESPSGWVEGGDAEIVFDADGTTEYSLLEIADASDNHLTLEIEPLLDRVRRRAGAARS